ncbi:universal stress protein [Geitlerinema sp. PCC 9228]|jgi:nucleotide-binding universal stress UspA family protein|uniref:universal stress protein n=1 Tax=Geitlerinema sp. PCC 9228 TaxID=111611 RepID=UPI0008F9DD7C|nr:universal stress protein [Geitlerinema sp. PCC 9228]
MSGFSGSKGEQVLFSQNRVLVPFDFSEESTEALEKTLAFVGEATHLYVIHVLPQLNVGEPGVMYQTTNDRTRKQHVEKVFWETFGDRCYQGLHLHVAIGDPSAAIVDYAKAQEIELIVIPSHGRTGLRRFLLGSVAERVIRFARCPVLVLRK